MLKICANGAPICLNWNTGTFTYETEQWETESTHEKTLNTVYAITC